MAIVFGNSYETFLISYINDNPVEWINVTNFEWNREILSLEVAAIEKQIRVAFVPDGEAVIEFEYSTDWTFDEDSGQYTPGPTFGIHNWGYNPDQRAVIFNPMLWNAANDRIVIWRETRTDGFWSKPTPVARAHGSDLMLYWNQLRMAFQDIAELPTIAAYLGQPVVTQFEPPYTGRSQAHFQALNGKDHFTYFDIELLRGPPGYPAHPASQLVVAVWNGSIWIDKVYLTDYQVNIDTENVEFISAPNAQVRIRRHTKSNAMWVQLPEGYAFDALSIRINQKQIRFLTEEAAVLPLFSPDDLLNNPIRSRGWNRLHFKGINGKVIRFGGRGWAGDGSFIVRRNDIPLDDPDDFTTDPVGFIITLIDDPDPDDDITIDEGPNIIINFPPRDPPSPLTNPPDVGPPFDEPQDDGGDGERGDHNSSPGDASIRISDPDTNYNTQADYILNSEGIPGFRRSVVMRFDLTDIDVSDYDTATLRLYIESGVDHDHDVFIRRLIPVPSIDEVTYNSYVTGSAWDEAGARGAGTDYDDTTAVTMAVVGEQPGNPQFSPNLIVQAQQAQDLQSGTYCIVLAVDDADPWLNDLQFGGSGNLFSFKHPVLTFSNTGGGPPEITDYVLNVDNNMALLRQVNSGFDHFFSGRQNLSTLSSGLRSAVVTSHTPDIAGAFYPSRQAVIMRWMLTDLPDDVDLISAQFRATNARYSQDPSNPGNSDIHLRRLLVEPNYLTGGWNYRSNDQADPQGLLAGAGAVPWTGSGLVWETFAANWKNFTANAPIAGAPSPPPGRVYFDPPDAIGNELGGGTSDADSDAGTEITWPWPIFAGTNLITDIIQEDLVQWIKDARSDGHTYLQVVAFIDQLSPPTSNAFETLRLLWSGNIVLRIVHST